MRALPLVAIALAGCTPAIGGGDSACNPLYRVANAAPTLCPEDWRWSRIAIEGQAIPRPDSLVKIDRETAYTVSRISTTR